MALSESYLQKITAIPAYFKAIHEAKAPERFSTKFLDSIGFRSSNDRLFIRVLKDLGFLDADGVPQESYFQFLDKGQSGRVLGEAIRIAYADLFAVNKNAQTLSVDELKNKLKPLFQGKKTDNLIDRIAKTFKALCDQADFTLVPKGPDQLPKGKAESKQEDQAKSLNNPPKPPPVNPAPEIPGRIGVAALQYHINIVLPESRDQAVYDALFKSLREHLG